jgi:hypothetical protein
MQSLTRKKLMLVLIAFLVFTTFSLLISASSVEVVVLSQQAYVASPGSYYIEGEVLNIDSQPRENIKITAILFDSKDNLIGVGITNNPNVINPRVKSHFTVAYIDPQQVPLIDHYALSISSTIVSPLSNTPK